VPSSGRVIPPPPDLTLPRAGVPTLRAALSAALKRLAQDLGRLPLASLSPDARATLTHVLRATKAELAREPGRVFGVLRRPNVGAALRVLRERADDAIARQLAATLAVELAAAGAELPALRFEGLPPEIVCLGARRALPGGDATLARGEWSGRAILDHPSPFTEIEGGIVLAEVDDNPLSMLEAHPDKLGNAIDLGGRDAETWADALREALGLIAEHTPALRETIALLVHQIVPVGYDAEQHLSASYREALGTLYLTLHPSPLTMAEALIHETQHNVLNAVFELDPLLENAFSPLFSSPVRPDPRPLHGVLLAVHAFLPVAELHRRMAEAGHPLSKTPEFARRVERVREGNREGAAVLLENAAPTAIGRALLDEIARLV